MRSTCSSCVSVVVSMVIASRAGALWVAGNADLSWRLRYDVIVGSVVLEVRRATDFAQGLPAGGSPNQLGVGAAINGSIDNASNDWTSVLGVIAGLSSAERAAAYDFVGGEAIADMTTAASMAACCTSGGTSPASDGTRRSPRLCSLRACASPSSIWVETGSRKLRRSRSPTTTPTMPDRPLRSCWPSGFGPE